jgi:hypothetical protein
MGDEEQFQRTIDMITTKNTDLLNDGATNVEAGMEIINRPNYIGQTALILCIIHGRFNFVTKLLSLKKLDVSFQTFHEQKNALMFAAERGYSGIVSNLLNFKKKSIDIDTQDIHGKTALMYACENLNFSSVQALLKFKPNVNMRDINGRTALHHIYCNNFSAIGKRHNKKYTSQGSSPQYIYQALLNANINEQIKDRFGKTASDYIDDKNLHFESA